ncbi:MAG: glycosyltransferase family 9 protein [Bacteriovoracaceae bacterium]|nr:glycosyltransferase family 9 protein [Bacteriovoracaceae bacterium]
MRFLLIRFSSLGDIVLQTSFASWLKSKYPQCHISFLTLKGNEALIQGHPHIDELLVYKKGRGASDISNLYRFCREELKSKNFNLIVDLHGTTRSFLTRCFLPEVQSLAMDKRRFERSLLVKAKIDLLKGESSLHDRNLRDLAWAFNKSYDEDELLSFLSKSFPNNLSLTTSSVSGKFQKEKAVVIAPGASFKEKRWPVERFYDVALNILENTSFKCVVVGGPEDDFCSIFDQLQTQFPGRCENLQGKLSLSKSMEVVAKASLLIGNDSLMSHVAESCSTPSYSIFGPTSESFGFAPRLKDSHAFSVDIWCRPCSTTGSKTCFRKKPYCMLKTTSKIVSDKAISYLNNLEASDV